MNKRKIKEIIIKTGEGTLNLKGDLEKIFRVRDSRDRKIFYSVIVGLFLVLIYLVFIRGYFVKEEQKKIALEKVKFEQIRQERILKIEEAPKSRISFFLTSPVRANLAIPDYWEGNYRLSESPGKASFLYIEDPSRPVEIFYIRMLEASRLDELEEGEKEISKGKLVEKKGTSYAFVFKMSEDNPYAEDESLRAKFDRMKIDGQEMIKRYFKTF